MSKYPRDTPAQTANALHYGRGTIFTVQQALYHGAIVREIRIQSLSCRVSTPAGPEPVYCRQGFSVLFPSNRVCSGVPELEFYVVEPLLPGPSTY